MNLVHISRFHGFAYVIFADEVDFVPDALSFTAIII